MELHSTRATNQYIGVMTRTDLCSAIQLLSAGHNEPEEEDIKSLNRIIKYYKATSNLGLKFINLDIHSVKLFLSTDASFAFAKNMKSQIGFVIVLVDGNRRANIVHYGR